MTKELKSSSIITSKIGDLKKKSQELKDQGITPYMQVILVGDNPASTLYVRNKEKLCLEIGAKFKLIKLDQETQEEEFLSHLKSMNANSEVTGCFVQLPLPSQLKHINVTELINPLKDIDGFCKKNVMELFKGNNDGLAPCTPKGIITLLDFYNIDLAQKNIIIIGRSLIVGKPLSLMLTNRDATVTLCHSKTKSLKSYTKKADIIISAVGSSRFLTKDYFREDSTQIIIDVGINKDSSNKTCGDVDFDNVKKIVKAITPVPGGVGPLTVFSLMQNLLTTTENILTSRK